MRYVAFVQMSPPPQPDTIYDGAEMLVLQAQLGGWDNLNHLIICKSTGQAAIVDPFSGRYWARVCGERGYSLTSALLTHSHWDHSKGVAGLLKAIPEVRVWVHELESERGWEGPDTDRWDNPPLSSSEFSLGNLTFEVHCTPGHTPGHVTICGHGIVLSGDCLFLGRCGRTDLFGGDIRAQHESLIYLKSILAKFPEDWLVLPGHQYPLEDGSLPTFTTVGELLVGNTALVAAGDWEEFSRLEFLSFDDSLAVKARRQRAKTREHSH